MGQKKALFYKYWILTKRQKGATFCQLVTPLMCLGLIKLVLHLVNTADLPTEATDGVIPALVYPANLITPKWNSLLSNLFKIENPIRINRWTAEDDQTKKKFENWIQKMPNLMTFKHLNDLNEYEKYPRWDFFDKDTSITGLNNQLISDIKVLNGLNTFELPYNTQLPDSSYRINKTDDDFGISAHVQINNILYFRYHRKNGDSLFDMTVVDPKTGGRTNQRQFLAKATESSIGHMNLLNNIFLQTKMQDDLTNIISVISPTIDSSSIMDFINSALSIITTNLFPAALCLGFPIMLFVLVMEKDEKIKDLLDINGLVTINYWITFFVYNFINLELTVFIFLAVGKIFIDIEYFQKSSFVIMFWFLSAWNCSQIGFALFMSTFIKSPSSATLAGYTISIFLILFLCMMSQFLFPNPGNLPMLFYFFPQSALVRFFYLSISRCIDFKCVDSFGDIFDGEMLTVFIFAHFGGIIYFGLGMILNEPKLYKMFKLDKIEKFFKPKRKVIERKRTKTGEKLSSLSQELLENLSDDINEVSALNYGLKEEKHKSTLKYEEKVQDIDPNDPNYVLVAKGLSKSYPCTQGIKRALVDFSIAIEKGKIFGLLGPNGAGKTTFLSLVTGTNAPDTGEAWIAGNDTSDRTLHAGNIGFCPQFDILWPLLNVKEHLIFLSMFKGKSRKEAEDNVMEVIKQVDLEEDHHKMANQLSGGMKRRCSLAMALTGNPKIVFLDEPSSGLDPVKRRHFWELVKSVTSDRAVLLTTHLMEEADTLCSEIGIITTGKMRCVGNSIYLKNNFTEGIKIQIMLDKEKISSEKFMEMLKKEIPGVRLDSEFEGTLVIILDDNKTEKVKMSKLFEVMYSFVEEKSGLIRDWSISLGSLEDVFLSVVRKYRESNIFKK